MVVCQDACSCPCSVDAGPLYRSCKSTVVNRAHHWTATHARGGTAATAVTAGRVQVEQLVLEELHRIRKEGFTASAIDAAINTTEFSLRENNTGRFPRGLSMMLRAMNAWVYERDPYKCAPHPCCVCSLACVKVSSLCLST